MHELHLTDDQLLARLKAGLENDYIAPWFQPVMDPSGTIMLSAEALPRFMDPDHGIISPMTFIGIAKDHGLLAPIGGVLLQKTCAAYAVWADRGIAPELVTINLSGMELQDEQIVGRIEQALGHAGIGPRNLGIEVVESVAFEDGHERALAAIDAFCDMGVSVTVDDLGAVRPDPENLRRLRASTAKVDRLTVSQLGVADEALHRVKALAEVTKAMGIPLIAKGVETRVQIDLLVESGCAGQQGFAIARPMPLDSFTEWLDLNTGWGTDSTNAA